MSDQGKATVVHSSEQLHASPVLVRCPHWNRHPVLISRFVPGEQVDGHVALVALVVDELEREDRSKQPG
jgi:hypothetical protein